MTPLINRLSRAITASPIVWGLLGSAVFYGLVHGGPLGTPFIKRYFTGHPVEYGETVMFAIGLSALVLRAIDVVPAVRLPSAEPLLGSVSAAGRVGRGPAAGRCSEHWTACRPRRQESYLGRRLRRPSSPSGGSARRKGCGTS